MVEALSDPARVAVASRRAFVVEVT